MKSLLIQPKQIDHMSRKLQLEVSMGSKGHVIMQHPDLISSESVNARLPIVC